MHLSTFLSVQSSALFITLFLFFTPKSSFATSIVPFRNMGEMSLAAHAVVVAKVVETFETRSGEVTNFRYHLQVTESIKGVLQPGSQFFVQRWSRDGTDWKLRITGDVELETGRSYLLCVEPNEDYWRPILMGYAIFTELNHKGEVYLVPTISSFDIQTFVLPDGSVAEPLRAYEKTSFVKMLKEVCQSQSGWEQAKVKSVNPDIFSREIESRSAPGHCNFLGADVGIAGGRWQNFPAAPLPVWMDNDGDVGCSPASNANVRTGDAIADIAGTYSGTNIVNNGTLAFTPNCSGGSAVGGNFISFLNSLGGSRNILVQYNDPCNEITNLTGCSGTLAFGGTYFFGSTHAYDGQTWRNVGYGFVVVNNGVGACYCNSGSPTGVNYKILITHELTHALSLDHIAGSGTANMNPNCCMNIQGLDMQCVNYLYAPLLPVELIDFQAEKNDEHILLQWQTGSETNNDFFVLERSPDGIKFEKIAQVRSKGSGVGHNDYEWKDQKPLPGNNYYRLSQRDFDGEESIFKDAVRQVYFGKDDFGFKIFPNPAARQSEVTLEIFSPKSSLLQIQIFDTQGTLKKSWELHLSKGWFSEKMVVGDLSAGIYFVKIFSANAAPRIIPLTLQN